MQGLYPQNQLARYFRPAELRGRLAMIDGEIVSLDREGKSQFRDLLFQRGSEWDGLAQFASSTAALLQILW